MNAKSFLFVAAWMKPLKTLPLEQRWNVVEAIAEYATTGQLTKELDPMEALAFLFIRNEIDRMNCYRKERSERRHRATKTQQEKDREHPNKAIETHSNDANDANACNEIHEDAPFDIISVSVSESKSESVKKSSSSTRMRVREGKNLPISNIFPNFAVLKSNHNEISRCQSGILKNTNRKHEKNCDGFVCYGSS